MTNWQEEHISMNLQTCHGKPHIIGTRVLSVVGNIERSPLLLNQADNMVKSDSSKFNLLT
ncbi:hypothetical protein NIES2100_01380 [Calothrix sp. NIES-2100]|uniref:hypothetical protein n=1 Tax=Calothrix sp. NIES-2100 TaxID=1954172 RepID=UPI000B6112B7|nr:hypothetical protein NIES2100_01380 [Calothrix sp. NIES-2100]